MTLMVSTFLVFFQEEKIPALNNDHEKQTNYDFIRVLLADIKTTIVLITVFTLLLWLSMLVTKSI